MLTSHYDWEERQHRQGVRQSLDSMVAPSVEDAVELAENERLKYG